ncbi:MAG TPA: tetratricopeptide repeat protein [Acetobacteraceae bacterium]|nr:tetratricopeptide repeat protein [Acetobacteraceae bacterium]
MLYNESGLSMEQAEAVAEPGQQLRQAATLESEGRFGDALAVLQEQMTLLPASERPWLQVSRLLASMQRVEEAERLLAEAQQHLPNEVIVFIQHARFAEARSDWAAADRRWAEVRTRWPRHPDGWTGGVRTLSQLGQIDAAELLADQGWALFPLDAALAFVWADLPRLRGDLAPRADRWAQVRTMHPQNPGGYAAGALALLDLGRLEHAEQVASEGCSTFPADRDVHRAYGVVLLTKGEIAAAEQVLSKALQIDRNDSVTHLHYIRAAMARNDRPEVARRNADAQKLFPGDSRFYSERFEVPAEVDPEDPSTSPATPPQPRAPKPTGRLRRLLRQRRN